MSDPKFTYKKLRVYCKNNCISDCWKDVKNGCFPNCKNMNCSEGDRICRARDIDDNFKDGSNYCCESCMNTMCSECTCWSNVDTICWICTVKKTVFPHHISKYFSLNENGVFSYYQEKIIQDFDDNVSTKIIKDITEN